MASRSPKAKRCRVLFCAAILAGAGAGFFPLEALHASPPVSFKAQVLPIFEQHCVSCHSPTGVAYKAIGLDLRSYDGLMAGSQFGVAVIPRHPELSPLIQAITPDAPSFKNLKMPPLGPPLSPAVIDVISRWIQEGTKDN